MRQRGGLGHPACMQVRVPIPMQDAPEQRLRDAREPNHWLRIAWASANERPQEGWRGRVTGMMRPWDWQNPLSRSRRWNDWPRASRAGECPPKAARSDWSTGAGALELERLEGAPCLRNGSQIVSRLFLGHARIPSAHFNFSSAAQSHFAKFAGYAEAFNRRQFDKTNLLYNTSPRVAATTSPA